MGANCKVTLNFDEPNTNQLIWGNHTFLNLLPTFLHPVGYLLTGPAAPPMHGFMPQLVAGGRSKTPNTIPGSGQAQTIIVVQPYLSQPEV